MINAKSYYYSLMSKQEQKVYYAMKTGLETMAASFVVPRLERKNLADIYFLLRLDYPELFYSVKFTYRYYQNSENVEIIPEYLFAKNKLEEQKRAMEARIKKLLRQAEGLDEFGKELFIHDFICQNVRYDKLKKAYSHEIIGPLGQGIGVCEGIAKTVKILCDALGIWCIIAISDANPEKNIKYRHAWNVVRIGNEMYHLDATFDNTITNSMALRYDYVNLNDTQFFRDHEPVIWQVPECKNGDHAYYREKKLSFTKYEEVRKRTAQAVKKEKVLLFHWRGGYLTKNIMADLLRIFEEEAAKKEKFAFASVNWSQAVLQVSFAQERQEQAVKLETVDESVADLSQENM